MIVDLDRFVRRLEPNGEWSNPAPLSTYRYAPAYVLLGDPGAGKSTAFEREQSATPRAEPVTARDFRTIYGDALSPQTETLFIDGLDEARAGGGDPRSPFDEIRTRLRQLTPKRVRCSCRELDWLGENDRTNLSKVVPGGEVIVLRLETLNANEQRLIIGADPRIADPAAFLIEAADRGVEGLLTNAQTLSLLVRVVAENTAFPEGRTETFEQACRLLAREPNDEHRIAAPLPEPEALVEAAGQMCAVSLLSGSVGFSLPDGRESQGFVPISRFGANAATAERAAHTRLFTSIGGGRFVPVHANIAAFLAAEHLARLVDGLVPAGRILALLSGNDGLPPTPLRSLVAWLAVTAGTLRRVLIERDPVAVLMYGDVRKFTSEEKALLLAEVAGNPSRLYEGRWPDSALAGLAGTEMEPTLRDLLTDPDRSDAKQTVVEIVTKALTHAPANEGLAEVLLDVARDETRWLHVREFALDAWIHGLAENPARDDRFREVLAGILDGSIKDYGGQNLGALLRKLYPRVLGPAELWGYFGLPSQPLFGRFYRFWSDLPDTCPRAHLPAHLDHLAQSGDAAHTGVDLPRPNGLPIRFLARALETYGARVEVSRLTAWLRVGLEEHGLLRPEGPDGEETSGRIRDWLTAHPETQKAVIRFALRTEHFRELESVEYHLNELLYQSSLPEDIGAWHLDEAITAEDTDLTTKHLIQFTRELARKPVDVQATLAEARIRLAGKPDALRLLESLRSSPLDEWRLKHSSRRQQHRANAAQRSKEFSEAVLSEEEELRRNRASPGLLYALAQTYFEGRQVRRPPEGREHLVEALGGDELLAETALKAIRRTIERDDLPSAQELARLRRRNQTSWFEWPVLIGLANRPVDDVLALGDGRLRSALACRLLKLGLAQEASWYKRCVQERPDLVAEVLVLVGRVLVASGETSVPDLQQLAHDENHAEVARRATLPLLRAFPARAKDSQLVLLDALLRSGLRNLVTDGQALDSFRELIEDKVRQPSTTRIARVRWLAAGLVLDADLFLPELTQELESSDKRIRSLARFFAPFGYEQPEGLTPAALEFLIRTLGRHSAPLVADSTIQPADGILRLLPRLITQLSQDPTRSAAEALARLAADEALSKWQPRINDARDAQRVVRRDATFAPPGPGQVIAALRDGPPASAADLRELVVDRLAKIAKRIRSGNENPWRPYWNEDAHGRPYEPKPEESCRDELLKMLRATLPAGCDPQPEGQHARNRRSDVVVTRGDLRLPIELKKADHRDVWRSAREQLLAKYAADDTTGGFGIYVVLWFGRDRVKIAPTGRRPQNPDEMRRCLEETLDSEHRRRIAIHVLDVTRPD